MNEPSPARGREAGKEPGARNLPSLDSHEIIHDDNNLDAIRLAAALLVLASHAYILTGHPDDEPIARLLSHSIDGGALAVAVFFILSGFLIARSALRHTPRAYAIARIRRIYPAYLAVVMLQALVLGPLLTSLPLATYLTTPALWSGLARSLLFTPHQGLPGVFDANPLPGLVNASLWTLRIEVLCYAATLALARLGLLRRGPVLLPLALAWTAILAIVAARAGDAPASLIDIRVTSIADCVLNFMMGAAAWTYRASLPLASARTWAWAWAGAGALTILALAPTPLAPIAWHLVLPGLVLTLGSARPVTAPLMRRIGDLSYGAYLYAFPIAQSLLAIIPRHLAPLDLIAIGLPLTLLAAALSRHLIERPFLQPPSLQPPP